MILTREKHYFFGIAIFLWLLLFSIGVVAEENEEIEVPVVLNLNTISSADIGTLSKEVELFETIRKGIQLSLAGCETSGFCLSTTSEGEFIRLIQILRHRIEGLTTRLEEEQSDELAQVLERYQKESDAYDEHLAFIQDVASQFGFFNEVDFIVAEEALTQALLEYEESELFEDDAVFEDDGFDEAPFDEVPQ